MLVGYESGNQQILYNIKKGMRIEVAEQFTKDCHELGIQIHGTFILGLPGESPETIRETVDFAKRINPHTIQVSLAAPYPGTFLYNQAGPERLARRRQCGTGGRSRHPDRAAALPASVHEEIFDSLEDFYKRVLFPPGKIASIVGEMVRSPDMMKRRLREGVEFFQFLRERRSAA